MLDEGLPILSAEHEQKRLRAVAGGGHAVGQRQGGVFPAVEPRLLKGARKAREGGADSVFLQVSKVRLYKKLSGLFICATGR